MPVIYEYDSGLNTIHARPYGMLSILEIGNYFNEVTNDDEITTGIIEVVHFKNVKEFLFSSSDALIIPKLYREFKDTMRLRRTILIGESELHFGIARMLQIILEMNDIKSVVFVVRDEKEANKLIKEAIIQPLLHSDDLERSEM